MSPLQKNSDGIRKSGSSRPIRLSPKEPHADPKPAERMESETELHWEEEGRAQVLHEMRGSDAPEAPARAEISDTNIREFASRPARPWPSHQEERGRDTFPFASRMSVFRKGRYAWAHIGAYAGVVAVAALFILFSTVFARLTVTVKPRVEEAAIVHVGVRLDASVSKVLFSQKVVPAEKLSFSRAVTKDFPATGTGHAEERARGAALIYNAFNTNTQQLVSGTRFVTDTGMVYRIQKPVTVPAAKMEQGKLMPQAVEAELIADTSGEAGNRSGSLSLKLPGFRGSPRYEGFYAVAPQGFAGGFVGDAAVVTKEDRAGAEETVSKAVFGDLEAEMGRALPAGLTMLKELREIEVTRLSSPNVGSRAPGAMFTVSAEARGTVLAFREADVVALLTATAVDEGEDEEFIPGSARLSYAMRSWDSENGKAEMTIGGDLKVKAKIPEGELAILLAGKKEGSAADLLKARKELAGFRLSFFPPWRGTAPRDPAKIRFRVENQ